ncbi:hypothetical protein VNO78_24256 [Psophocarpus tetragonolobus]|uniref:CG-1 domain-containing protein n=1 Tax=Psophocarpus tetragonolobus TaxID=3891 RepID=A0AAN9S4A8_PSOTE
MEGFDYIHYLSQEAKKRWFLTSEVLYILKYHKKFQFTLNPPHQPTGGSIFLYDRKIQPFFREDGHNWLKEREDTISESIGLSKSEIQFLHGYYAHGEENPSFKRRSYLMLEQ